MKVETERWLVVILLIVIVVLFVRLLFIFTNNKKGYSYHHPSARFQDTPITSSSCGNDNRYMMVKRDIKYVQL